MGNIVWSGGRSTLTSGDLVSSEPLLEVSAKASELRFHEGRRRCMQAIQMVSIMRNPESTANGEQNTQQKVGFHFDIIVLSGIWHVMGRVSPTEAAR